MSLDNYRKGAKKLMKASEETSHFPEDFIQTIEYLNEVFMYILSLIEIKKKDNIN